MWDFKLLANGSDGPLFDFTMAGHAGNLAPRRMVPDAVGAAFAIKNTAVSAEVLLQGGQLHASAS